MARTARKLSSTRDAMLREMGLGPIWRLRTSSPEVLDQDSIADIAPPDQVEQVAQTRPDASLQAPLQAQTQNPAPGPAPTAPTRPSASAPAGDTRPALNDVPPSAPTAPRAAPGPTARAATQPTPQPAAQSTPRAVARTRTPADPQRSARIATLDWDALEADIRACSACVLCERRKQAVPGIGDRQATWMFVGEGPGSEEDQRGEPFVGQAGRLLDNMLAALGLTRGENVYIANAVKCRPPHNRTPVAAELDACLPYLERQIALVQPRLLVALGRPAALALLNTEVSIAAARGRRFDFKGIPLVVTYHPAYLLRNPQDKGKAWADLCFARQLLASETPGGC